MKRLLIILACLLVFAGCKSEKKDAGNTTMNVPRVPPKTTATAPLPEGAFKVVLFLSKLPTTVDRAGQRVLQVKVRNAGAAVWPSLGQDDGKFWVKAGNRWIDEKNEKNVVDDGRALLPYDVAPGEEVEFSLIVTAPKKPGEYILEVGMLQEHVAWFQEKGATSLKMKVTVK